MWLLLWYKDFESHSHATYNILTQNSSTIWFVDCALLSLRIVTRAKWISNFFDVHHLLTQNLSLFIYSLKFWKMQYSQRSWSQHLDPPLSVVWSSENNSIASAKNGAALGSQSSGSSDSIYRYSGRCSIFSMYFHRCRLVCFQSFFYVDSLSSFSETGESEAA